MTFRLKINIHGAVQGVGFRPFIYRLATEMNIKGFVLNSSAGVWIEAEAEKDILDSFLFKIEKEKPKAAIVNSMEFSFLDPINFSTFEIKKSDDNEEKTTLILPDIAVCDDCLEEMFNPSDRRYKYPFINCTNCGPRFSIIESLPYDRPNTSMKEFEMCEDCKREYVDPLNRRFHAQPIACPNCGPHIELWDNNADKVSSHDEALLQTIGFINDGKIIALKGIGGFQLLVDASNSIAVAELRKRKKREEKPFALMFPNLEQVKLFCEVSVFEERLLKSAEAPIVLLKRKNNNKLISEFIAPNNPYLGVMLPYSPIHHLLLKELNSPIVATSANISEEPIVIDENEALQKLKEIADYFLVNNRNIVRHADDSIVRIVMGREMVTRRARGYAPLPLSLQSNNSKIILAVGGHLKNTVSFKVDSNIFSSQHIGDLSTFESINTFEKVINNFQLVYGKSPDLVVSDLHPEYVSTKFANDNFKNVLQIQHHEAHIAGCILENQVEGNVLGISWDGTGYGYDGNIWGGEFFHFTENEVKHIGRFRNFFLPGGDVAIKEPRRSAIGLLYKIFGDKIFNSNYEFLKSFTESELNTIHQMLKKKINTRITSSVGRLFDAVSAILNINHKMSFEGQAAMMLEFSTISNIEDFYPFEFLSKEITIIDWQQIVLDILTDINGNISKEIIATKFHNTMAEIIVKFAEQKEKKKIALSGGVFQNAYLLEKTIKKLQENNFKPYWHQRIPTNDGGISVGQIAMVLKYNYKTVVN